MEVMSSLQLQNQLTVCRENAPGENDAQTGASEGDVLLFCRFLSELADTATGGPILMECSTPADANPSPQQRPRTRQWERLQLGFCERAATAVHESAPGPSATKPPINKYLQCTSGRPTFVPWPPSRLRMAQPRGNQLKRKMTPPRRSSPGDDDAIRRPREGPQRGNAERRSTQVQEQRTSRTVDVKGKGRMRSPVARKRKVLEVMSDSSSEEERPANRTHDLPAKQRGGSVGAGTADEDEEDDEEQDDKPPRWDQERSGRRGLYKEDGTLIKPVQLDVQGVPHGSMMLGLSADVKKYAKLLDPTCSWEGQPAPQKYRLYRRIYSDWEMEGPTKKVSDKWIAPLVTKVLISTRFRLNALIDGGLRRPPEVTREQWEILVTKRKSEAAQKKSDHMRAISKGKGSKALQLRAIEREAIIKLSILHKRAPYASEIAAEVGRECQRQEEENIRVTAERNGDLSDMRTRVADMEGSVTRLQDSMHSSQRRVEDMLRQLMSNLPQQVGLSRPTGIEVSLPTEAAGGGTGRPRSLGMPSETDSGVPPAVGPEDELFTENLVHEDDGEFIKTFFGEGSPDNCNPIVAIHEGGPSVAVLDAQVSLDGHPPNSPLNLVDELKYDPETESVVGDDEDMVMEALDVEKDMDEVAEDSGGRTRRSLKNGGPLKSAKLPAATKPSKVNTSKAASLSKAPSPSSTKFSQPKKLDSTKKK